MPSWLTVSRRRVLAASILGVLALVLATRQLADARAPAAEAVPVEAVQVEEAPPARLTVHVVGAVRRPGLYRLQEGSRVADAVGRAGGATRRADLAGLNLAAPVADGLQVVVPRRGAGTAAGAAGAAASGGPVHLNTATLEQLDALPGVGPVTAQKIVQYREQHGGFASVDDLDAVPGIGPARLETLRELVAP